MMHLPALGDIPGADEAMAGADPGVMDFLDSIDHVVVHEIDAWIAGGEPVTGAAPRYVARAQVPASWRRGMSPFLVAAITRALTMAVAEAEPAAHPRVEVHVLGVPEGSYGLDGRVVGVSALMDMISEARVAQPTMRRPVYSSTRSAACGRATPFRPWSTRGRCTASALPSAASTSRTRSPGGRADAGTTRLADPGQATGIDISGPMLEEARRRAATEGVRNATFALGDVQVYELPPDAFDVAISRAGVMFFADPVAAFANVGRALRPDGRLAFVCHRAAGESPVMEALVRAGVPLDPAAVGSAATAFTDADHVCDVVTRAGFVDVTATAIDVISPIEGGPHDAALLLLGGNLRPLLRNADEATFANGPAAVADSLRRYERRRVVELPAAGWVFSGRRGAPGIEAAGNGASGSGRSPVHPLGALQPDS